MHLCSVLQDLHLLIRIYAKLAFHFHGLQLGLGEVSDDSDVISGFVLYNIRRNELNFVFALFFLKQLLVLLHD